MKKFVIYEIRNKVNNFIYVGVHKCENINDNYMGSGSAIKRAIKQFGKENFEKKILYVFDNKEEALLKEYEIVNHEFLKRFDVYNLTLGGGKVGKIYSEGFVNVKDKNGNNFKVRINDPRYLSGELVGVNKGKVVVKNSDGEYFRVDVDDQKYLKKELLPLSKGKFLARDKNGNSFLIDKNDPRYLTEELVPYTTGKLVAKDKIGNCFLIDKDDPRYLSGELKGNWTDKKHNEETKKKIGKANSKHQHGKNNSQFETCWITNGFENKKIKKNETIPENWERGRTIKKC